MQNVIMKNLYRIQPVVMTTGHWPAFWEGKNEGINY